MADPTNPQTPGRQKSVSRRPTEAPEAEDKKAAFREVMRKQVSRVALTIKHTDVQKEELRDLLGPMCRYLRVGHELHEEHVPDRPDDHLHAYLQLSAQKRLGEIYKLVQDKLDDRYYGRPDVRQLPSNTDAAKWNNYCKKDGDYIDHGELQMAGPARKRGEQDEAPYHEFLHVAATEGVDAAMAYASEELVEQYCTRYSALKEAAESKKPRRTKYDLPSMEAKDVQPRQWQKAWLPRVVEKKPTRRRIHWVWGSPGQGKSWVHDFLDANHPHGCFNAGNRCCLDNLAYNYNEEGVVMWDFPKNFDWDGMSLAAASVIEKFSDFGTPLRSLKYKGKSCYARGHVVVFANRPPIAELAHRDVQEFHIDSYVAPIQVFKTTTPSIPIAVPVPAERDVDGSAAAEVSGGSLEERHLFKQRASSKQPREYTGAMFKTRGKLVPEGSHPCLELEGGATDPKAAAKKGPLQAPPEAPPEGGLGRARCLSRFSTSDTETASEASTP